MTLLLPVQVHESPEKLDFLVSARKFERKQEAQEPGSPQLETTNKNTFDYECWKEIWHHVQRIYISTWKLIDTLFRNVGKFRDDFGSSAWKSRINKETTQAFLIGWMLPQVGQPACHWLKPSLAEVETEIREMWRPHNLAIK